MHSQKKLINLFLFFHRRKKKCARLRPAGQNFANPIENESDEEDSEDCESVTLIEAHNQMSSRTNFVQKSNFFCPPPPARAPPPLMARPRASPLTATVTKTTTTADCKNNPISSSPMSILQPTSSPVLN